MTLLDPGIIEEFFAEGNEHLDALESCLLRLESDPADQDAVNRAFRAAHSIKGAAGFLGLAAVERLMHASEDLLDLFRGGKATVDAARASALLRAGDRCRTLLASARDGVDVDTGTVESMVVEIRGFVTDASRPASAPAAAAPHVVPVAPATQGPAAASAPADAEAPITRSVRVPRGAAAPAATAAAAPPTPAAAHVPAAPPPPATVAAARTATPSLALATVSVSAAAPPPTAIAAAAAPPAPEPPARPVTQASAPVSESPRPTEGGAETGAGTIRVDVSLLDDIVNLVGELVVARNRLVQVAGEREDRTLSQASRRVDHLTSDLQNRVMKTRMRPVAVAWGALPRLVRDVAAATGKQVAVAMEGQETELDRGLLEAIKDPLSHMIRNCVDHGIEPPDVRVAAGKPATGTISLRARHSGGQVFIEVADDGRGIQVERVRSRAIERGLLSADMAATMSDEECLQLIFQPGFSTAETVSNLSGRGVGMDVVKRSVEQAGGSVDLRSEPGLGTTIRLKLPLTLAIVPALITLVGERRFCISQTNLVEIVDLMTDEARSRVEWLAGAPIFRLRGQLLPLVPLTTTLELSNDAALKGYIVVVDADDVNFGVVVDEIQHTEEIVVKPVGAEIKRVEVFSGATVLGDGSVALIVDVAALARRGRVAARMAQLVDHEAIAAEEGARRTLLRLSVDTVGMVAVDVSSVLRIDEMRAVEMFRHGDDAVFRYQDRVVPLRALASAAGSWNQIVVCEHGNVVIGLAVTEVLDVVTVPVQVTRGIGAPWAEGVGFVQGMPTALLDVSRLSAGGAA